MGRFFLLTIAILFLSCNSEKDKKVTNDSTISKDNNSKDSIIGRGTFLTDKELEYIKTRDRYIKYFNEPKNPKIGFEQIEKQNNDSLLVLEKLMQDILKDTKVGNGTNNLRYLFDDMDFGLMDGLVTCHDSAMVVCTTKNLFFYYFMNDKINQLDQLTSKDLEKIFDKALLRDEVVTDFTTIKFSSTNNINAYGAVGITYNGEPLGPPNTIFGLVADDKYIYLFQKDIHIKLEEIKECRKFFDSVALKPGNTEDEIDKAEDKYCQCYQEKFKYEPQFDSIKKEIADIVNYIEH
jgi:hypothetical protein